MVTEMLSSSSRFIWKIDNFSKLNAQKGFYDPDKGYIVNDSCVIKFEVSCKMNKDSVDNDIKESDLVSESDSESESDMQIDPKDGNSRAVHVGQHPGEFFDEERHNSKGGFCEGEEFQDIGGFSISKTQASLYKQIWAKYGHIPSTKVMPISSYSLLVMAAKDLMTFVVEMHQCRFVELSTEMIEGWEEKIKMAEKLEFNISWLRERFETLKKGICGMQKFKAELLEHGQPLRAAKSKMKSIGDELKKAEVQLTAAKDYVRENVSGLLSESDMEMYLEMGDNLLFDGMF